MRVLLISFSAPGQARRWRAETGVDFPILLDDTRAVYRLYGLERSWWRAWQPKVWLQYARMLLHGWQWRGIQDDSSQLGGDFLVDGEGMVRFAYASSDPTDRPSLAQIEDALAGAR